MKLKFSMIMLMVLLVAASLVLVGCGVAGYDSEMDASAESEYFVVNIHKKQANSTADFNNLAFEFSDTPVFFDANIPGGVVTRELKFSYDAAGMATAQYAHDPAETIHEMQGIVEALEPFRDLFNGLINSDNVTRVEIIDPNI